MSLVSLSSRNHRRLLLRLLLTRLQDVAPVEALVSTLTPAQAAEVAVLWRQYAAARWGVGGLGWAVAWRGAGVGLCVLRQRHQGRISTRATDRREHESLRATRRVARA